MVCLPPYTDLDSSRSDDILSLTGRSSRGIQWHGDTHGRRSGYRRLQPEQHNFELRPSPGLGSVALCHRRIDRDPAPSFSHFHLYVWYRTTLVYIWLGVINQWDHPAIAALNPVLYATGKLPSATITLVYNTQGYLDITNVGHSTPVHTTL